MAGIRHVEHHEDWQWRGKHVWNDIMGHRMYLNSALLIWIGWRIGKGLKLYYYFGILVLSGNIFLTLTDEFGVFDLIVLVIAVGLFILLIVTRSKYLKA
jgi:hypothetical protein